MVGAAKRLMLADGGMRFGISFTTLKASNSSGCDLFRRPHIKNRCQEILDSEHELPSFSSAVVAVLKSLDRFAVTEEVIRDWWMTMPKAEPPFIAKAEMVER